MVPIDIGPDIKSSLSDIDEFHWGNDGVRATFFIPGAEHQRLEVSFPQSCIVRILDEMPLSTEVDDSPNEGLVSDHFAYRVEGALFFRTQSEAFRDAFPAVAHYRFITGWTCLDVICGAGPAFAVITRGSSS